MWLGLVLVVVFGSACSVLCPRPVPGVPRLKNKLATTRVKIPNNEGYVDSFASQNDGD